MPGAVVGVGVGGGVGVGVGVGVKVGVGVGGVVGVGVLVAAGVVGVGVGVFVGPGIVGVGVGEPGGVPIKYGEVGGSSSYIACSESLQKGDVSDKAAHTLKAVPLLGTVPESLSKSAK